MATDDKKTDEETIKEIKKDLGDKISLQTLHDSEGGQLLIKGLVADVLDAIESAGANVNTLSHIELAALVIKAKERIDVIKVLTGAKNAREVYDGLLSEELKKQEGSES